MNIQDPSVQAALKALQQQLGQHGGSVELLDINDEGVALVRLQGACQGCAAAGNTLRNVVEKTFKQMVPQISRVEAVM